jgi:hypothetical protein
VATFACCRQSSNQHSCLYVARSTARPVVIRHLKQQPAQHILQGLSPRLCRPPVGGNLRNSCCDKVYPRNAKNSVMFKIIIHCWNALEYLASADNQHCRRSLSCSILQQM